MMYTIVLMLFANSYNSQNLEHYEYSNLFEKLRVLFLTALKVSISKKTINSVYLIKPFNEPW